MVLCKSTICTEVFLTFLLTIYTSSMLFLHLSAEVVQFSTLYLDGTCISVIVLIVIVVVYAAGDGLARIIKAD